MKRAAAGLKSIPMRYLSTRGGQGATDFAAVMLAGTAADGGLFMPAIYPQFTRAHLEALATKPYAEVALQVLKPFTGDAVPEHELYAMIIAAYAGFTSPEVAPLRQLGDLNLLELFHGPTFAFKDIALQLLGRMMEWGVKRSGQPAIILGATSGDTGSAAIEALRGRAGLGVVILHPHGRTSAIQRQQMTTVTDENVVNLAVEGSFDDCQNLVKALFADQQFAQRHRLAAVNSINWTRIAAQSVYFVTSALKADGFRRKLVYSVPTGNFGDIFAGYVARGMGAPIGRLIAATNENDILARCFASGVYEPRGVVQTESPSMDIQVSSNFERLLFEAYGRDGAAVASAMESLRKTGRFTVSGNALAHLRDGMDAAKASAFDAGAVLARLHRDHGYFADPHTAVGVAAGERHVKPEETLIVLATAHAAKFPDAVKRATGVAAPVPGRLAALAELPERFSVCAAAEAPVRAAIAELAGRIT